MILKYLYDDNFLSEKSLKLKVALSVLENVLSLLMTVSPFSSLSGFNTFRTTSVKGLLVTTVT